MEVRLLGPVDVRRDGTPVLLGARMERALLTIVALEGGRVVPVDRLVDLLWDGRPPPKATAALHTKVAHLRRALQPDRPPRGQDSLLATVPPGYRLDRADVDLDIDRFESLVAEATRLGPADPCTAPLLEEGLGLWRGPALGEFADEEFARATAHRLEALRVEATELRAAAVLAVGDTARAIAELQPLVAAHPLREPARATLARALYRAGRQADALAALAEGRLLLRDELGLDPSPALRELERRILEHDPGLSSGPPPGQGRSGRALRAAPRAAHRAVPGGGSGTLVGRAAEQAALSDAVAHALGGAGSVVLVTGDAGMGKSALLALLRESVEAAGGVARTVVCRDGVSAPPFWPVLQMVRQAAAEAGPDGRARMSRALGPLRDMVPVLAGERASTWEGVDPAMVHLHLTDALGLALGGSGRAPLSLAVFDDVHAADPATLRLVRSLAATVDGVPTVLALAMRPEEGAGYAPLVDLLAALGRAPRLLRLDLRPLAPDAIAELVRAAAPEGIDDAVRSAITRRSEGNPFFALELTRLAAAGRAGDAPPGVGLPGGGVPAAVLDVLRQRFVRLPEGATDLLAVAAVAGGPVPAEDVAAVAGLPVDRALDLLDAAVASRLAVDAGDGRFALAHALQAEALLASLSSARRARLHRAFGDRLAARYGSAPETASTIAGHYLAARSQDGGRAALPWLEKAAVHALHVSALDQLRNLGEQVLEVLASSPPGGPDEAERYRHELWARSRIAYVDAWSGGFDSPTIREYTRMVRTWPSPPAPSPVDVELLWVAAMFQGQLGRLDDAAGIIARMAERAAVVDDATATYLHHDIAAVVDWMRGHFAAALEHLDAAEHAVGSGEVDLRRSLAFSPPTRIAVIRAHCLWHLGEPEAARTQIDTALRTGGEVGLHAAGFARRWALVLALMGHDTDRVRCLVSLPLRESSWEHFRYPSAMVTFAEGWLAAQDGDRDGGLTTMRAAHGALVDQGLSGGRSVLLGLLAEATLAAGDPRQAVAFCDAALALGERGERYWVPALDRLRSQALTTDQAEQVRRPQVRRQ